MRRLFWIALLALPACGNTYHPEYHPVTSVQYSQSISGAQGPVPFLAPPPPIGIPAPPPMPPPEMGW